jgi:hypothetical protein
VHGAALHDCKAQVTVGWYIPDGTDQVPHQPLLNRAWPVDGTARPLAIQLKISRANDTSGGIGLSATSCTPSVALRSSGGRPLIQSHLSRPISDYFQGQQSKC